MREIVVISGKGGTGKTSLVASFAVLGGRQVVADCDVDAADLHLILAPRHLRRVTFSSGWEAVLDGDGCTGCGACLEACRFEAISTVIRNGGSRCLIDPVACEGCGACVPRCPKGAISLQERTCGEWYVSETRCGPLVHARLNPGGENSGKLVTAVRQEARRLAEADGYPLVLVDGPPGIGCPVIASITGASLVVAVTEPTLSGEHDLERVLDLAAHFKIPACVLVNKWDLNPEMAVRIEHSAEKRGAVPAGRIRYDPVFTAAQVDARAVVETRSGAVGDEIASVWQAVWRAAG